MPHQNTGFRAPVKRVSRGRFDRLVRKHNAGHRGRGIMSQYF